MTERDALPPWRRNGARVLAAAGRGLAALGLRVGEITSWLVVGVIAAVLTTVALNALGVNEIARWQADLPLFGQALTINSVTELQWHLFGVLTLLGGTYALHHDDHVRVDLLYQRLSPRGRAMVDMVGHALLLIPFCLLIAWLYRSSVAMAWMSGERSNYGGLTDRYLIKAMLPAGLVFLALGAFGQICERAAGLLEPARLDGREAR